MDLEEARRLVYTRVQTLDPVNVLKIMGYLLLQDIAQEEMIQLALSPDALLHTFVSRAKQELRLLPVQSQELPQPDDHTYAAAGVYPASAVPQQEGDHVAAHPSLHAAIPPYMSNLYDILHQPEKLDHRSKSPDMASAVSGGDSYLSKLTRSSLDQQVAGGNPFCPASSSGCWRPCLYFARGFCKHGNTCRFLHTSMKPGSFSPGSDDSQESQGDSQSFESLEALESELRELLSGRVSPVSIASLPQLYYEKFGKTLQADGYLTESQRHGKAGYSLTKLLSKLKSTVSLIDRPHGQHAVVLTEEVQKSAGDELVPSSSSRQIYLTFPAESGFTEDDVTTHFSAYGPVQDVRIPYQVKRMFGFVTFTYTETVRRILAEGNPHYICGARVLVKPYKEKSRLVDRQRMLQSRSFDRNRHQQAALRCYLQDRTTMSDEELALALEQKLAELHIANLQKRMAESFLASAAAGAPGPPTFLEASSTRSQLKPDDQFPLPAELSQQNNPYGYVLDVVNDPADEHQRFESTQSCFSGAPGSIINPVGSSSEQQALPCNIQSDQKQKFMVAPRDTSPPTFFSHDIF